MVRIAFLGSQKSWLAMQILLTHLQLDPQELLSSIMDFPWGFTLETLTVNADDSTGITKAVDIPDGNPVPDRSPTQMTRFR